MKKPKAAALLFASLLLITSSACQRLPDHPGDRPARKEGRLKIVTTVAPLFSFTASVAGDLADVENFLPSGVGPHEYSFRPSDVKKIREAHILVKNGANLETWLDKLVMSAEEATSRPDGKKLLVVDTSAGVELLDNDPHIWLSPRNAIAQVKQIRDALLKADPERSESYIRNSDVYIKSLEVLDRDIREEVATWDRKEFVAFHPAFRYFARDYGLNQSAVIQESPEEEPSPRHIAQVIDTIRASGITAIFSEPQFSPKIVKAIAEDLDLQVYVLDTLETGLSSPGWYEDRMRANLAALAKVLKTSSAYARCTPTKERGVEKALAGSSDEQCNQNI